VDHADRLHRTVNRALRKVDIPHKSRTNNEHHSQETLRDIVLLTYHYL